MIQRRVSGKQKRRSSRFLRSQTFVCSLGVMYYYSYEGHMDVGHLLYIPHEGNHYLLGVYNVFSITLVLPSDGVSYMRLALIVFYAVEVRSPSCITLNP